MSSDLSLAERGASWARRSVTLKLFTIGGLVLVLLVPLLMLRGLVNERQNMRAQAVRSVSASWGGAQTVGGPVLTLPILRGDSARTGAVHLLPERLEVTGTVVPQVRRRGLFRVRLYTATLHLRATFARPDVAGPRPGRAPRSARTSPRSRSASRTCAACSRRSAWPGRPPARAAQTLDARPGLPEAAPYGSGVYLPVPLTDRRRRLHVRDDPRGGRGRIARRSCRWARKRSST